MNDYNLKNIHKWPIALRALLIGIACALTFYFGYSRDIATLNLNLKKAKQQETDLKQQLRFIISDKHNVQGEVLQFPQYVSLFNIWNNQLIRYIDLPQLLNEILKVGALNNIYFSLLNPGKETRVGLYMKTPIKLIAVGNYHQIAGFTSQLANLKWIIVVSNFTLSNENKNDVLGTKLAAAAIAGNLLTVEMNLEVYSRADKN